MNISIVETPYSNKSLAQIQKCQSRCSNVMFGCYDVMISRKYVIMLTFIFSFDKNSIALSNWIIYRRIWAHIFAPKMEKLEFFKSKFEKNWKFLEIFGFSKVKSSLSDVPFLINEQINLVRYSIVRNVKTTKEADFSSPKYVPIRCGTFPNAKV